MTDQIYPDAPGFKSAGTSEAAAVKIAPHAVNVRQRVRGVIEVHPAGITADEIAVALELSILTVRPRVSELRRNGKIEPTGDRRCNESGMTASSWRLSAREPWLPSPSVTP